MFQLQNICCGYSVKFMFKERKKKNPKVRCKEINSSTPKTTVKKNTYWVNKEVIQLLPRNNQEVWGENVSEYWSLRAQGARILSQTVRRQTLKKNLETIHSWHWSWGLRSLSNTDKQVRKRHLLHCSCQGHTSRSGQRKASDRVCIPCRDNTASNNCGTAHPLPLRLGWCIKIYTLTQKITLQWIKSNVFEQ